MRERKYKRNIAILKSYGDKRYKLTLHRTLRTKGIECPEDRLRPSKGTVNDSKLEENIMRARSKIYELACCNPWEYFSTFTIDKNKFDRYNLDKYHSTFSQWIRDYNKKYNLSIKYLTIPEMHKDGAWHEHGFIMGLPENHLRLFTLEEKLPYYIRDKLNKDMLVYDWTAYRDKFGFVDLEPIRNREAACKYVLKYISKNLADSVSEINAHMYYCSKGLQRAKEIKRGTLVKSVPFQFENDYVKIAWFENLGGTFNLIK